MNTIKVQETALRDEFELLARAAERCMNDPSLTPEERSVAVEEAKTYWQLSRVHADSLTAIEASERAKFSGQNKGESSKTVKRRSLLAEHREKVGKGFRSEVIRSAELAPEFGGLFEDFDEALRFANRHKI